MFRDAKPSIRKTVTWIIAGAVCAVLISGTVWARLASSSPPKPGATHATLSIVGSSLRFSARQVLFVSPLVGYAMAIEGNAAQYGVPLVVYRTEDGGTSWRRSLRVPLDTSAPVALRRLGPAQFALVGLTEAVYVTSLRGEAWRRVPIPPTTWLGAQSITFATNKSWYVLGNLGGGMGEDTATIYHSDNAGATWSVEADVGRDGLVSPMTGITFSTPQFGWIGQMPPASPPVTVLRTGDGGRTWAAITAPKLNDDILLRVQVATQPPTFFSEHRGVLPIVEETIPAVTWLATTKNGGATWSKPVHVPGNIYAISDAQHVWAAQGNHVWVSADGGSHWQVRTLPKGLQITSLDLLGAHHAWAIATYHGRIKLLATQDGGRHWTSP